MPSNTACHRLGLDETRIRNRGQSTSIDIDSLNRRFEQLGDISVSGGGGMSPIPKKRGCFIRDRRAGPGGRPQSIIGNAANGQVGKTVARGMVKKSS